MKMELYGFPFVFSRWQSNRCPLPGLEEMLNVYRNYYPDYSHYRFTWRI
jgi:hypothetical protein